GADASPARHQSLELQPLQGLADRRATDAELLGQRVLAQHLAGSVVKQADAVAEFGVDGVDADPRRAAPRRAARRCRRLVWRGAARRLVTARTTGRRAVVRGVAPVLGSRVGLL